MAHKIADAVLETTQTTGTGPLTLIAAEPGYLRAGDVLGVGDTTYFTVAGINAAGQRTGEWEVCLGAYIEANTIERTMVLSSSNGGNLVDFSAGLKVVYITLPAAKIVTLDPNGATSINSIKPDGGNLAIEGTLAVNGNVTANNHYLAANAGTYGHADLSAAIQAHNAASSGTPSQLRAFAGASGVPVWVTTQSGLDITGHAIASGNVETAAILRSDGAGARTAYISTGGDSNLQIVHPASGAPQFINTGANGFAFRNGAGTATVAEINDTGLAVTGQAFVTNPSSIIAVDVNASDFQIGISKPGTNSWYLRNSSAGNFALHLNSTGDVLTANTAGIGISGTVTSSGAMIANSGGADLLANGGLRLYNAASSALATLRFNAGVTTLDQPLTVTGLTTTDTLTATSTVKTGVFTFGTLPAAAVAGAGAQAYITDALSTTFNAAAVGGGAATVGVTSDGTNWRIS